MDKFQAFGKNFRCELPPLSFSKHGTPICQSSESNRFLTTPSSASFTPFATRTQQYVKEQLGQVQEKVCWSIPLRYGSHLPQLVLSHTAS